MKNEIIHLSWKELEGQAEGYFLKAGGLNREGRKFDAMRSRTGAIREELRKTARIRCLLTYYEAPPVSEGRLWLREEAFACPPFRLLRREEVRGAYAYLMTGEGFHPPGRDLLDQLLLDIWGTACIDAGRDLLRSRLLRDISRRFPKERESLRLSDSFGPGYYGMELSGARRLLDLLNGEQLGVSCLESGMMDPLKSSTGIYLVAEESARLPENSCALCAGNAASCRLCRQREGK